MDKTPDTKQFHGPLADWVNRLEALATSMRSDPRVNVSLYLAEPVDDEALARVESSWKIDAFAPAIRNLYRQANGLCFLWIATHHPHYPRVKERWSKTGFSLGAFGSRRIKPKDLPTSHQVDGFAGFVWEGPSAPPEGSPPWGAIYLPPLEKVMHRSNGFLPAVSGKVPDDLERSVAGKTWRGGSFEKAIRVFDYPDDYCPAAFVMEEGAADPRVVLADDHTDWASGRHASFEAYMEQVLATYGTTRARLDWFRGPPTEEVRPPTGSIALDGLLPPSIELAAAEDGATFDLVVEAITAQGSGNDPRLAALEKVIPGHRYKDVAKALGLAPFNRKKEEFLPEIAAATADPKAVDSKTAAKLMSAINRSDKTKAAYLEAFAVGLGGGGGGDGGGSESVTLKCTTCFDRSGLEAQDVDCNFSSEAHVKAWLGALGMKNAEDALVAVQVSNASGRKERSATVTATLSRPSGLEVGRRARSSIAPVLYAPVGDKTVRSIR